MQKFQCEEFEIMDAHTHIFPPKIAEKATVNIGHFYDIPMAEEGNAERLLQCGAKIGTKRYLVCSTATTSHQVESINDFIAEECGKHPEFYGFGTLHPDYADLEGETNRIIRLGLHGIKLHPDFQRFDIDSPGAYKIYEQIAGRLPVLIHMGTARIVRPYDLYPSGIRKILKSAPDIPIIMAHMGSFCMMKNPNENLENLPENVFIDTAMSAELEEAGEFEEIIRRFGTNRVLYGSDFPYGTQKAAIARIRDSSFTDSEKEDMLWRNAAKILKTVGKLPENIEL